MVLERARNNKQEFIFNSAYSSVYNPIERLWAIAKRQVARDFITEADYKVKEQIKALVMKSILSFREHAGEARFCLFEVNEVKN